MNDRLAEFASVQVEVVDEVLEMVARDRRRVEALLCEAESPSLRQYLQEWMDATTAPNLSQRSFHHSEVEQNAEMQRMGGVLASDSSNSASGSSCCWSDPSKSFWEIMPNQSYRKFNFTMKEAMGEHKLKRSRLAYGVSYDWLMRPMLGMGDDPPWGWEDMDHFFKGRDCKNLNENTINVQQLFTEQQSAFESFFYRKVLVPSSEGSSDDDKLLLNKFFGGTDVQSGCCKDCLPSASQVVKAGGSITYDIIFYAASIFEPLLYHNRTAKGTLVLQVSTELDGTELDSTNTSSRQVLEGSVELDPSMKCVDAVPFGGNFSWEETGRMERIISERGTGRNWSYSSTSVMLVNVTAVPSAPSSYIGRKAVGEVRVVRHRAAAMIEYPSNDGAVQLFDYSNPDDVAAHNEIACKRMDKFNNKRCLWMHRHTNLPKDIIERVGNFVCPPPAFYLEEGDLVIDIDWSDFVRPRDGLDLQEGVDNWLKSLMSNSSIVARPRT